LKRGSTILTRMLLQSKAPTYVSLLIFVTIIFISRTFQDAISSFYTTDSDVYFRIIKSPILMRFTSPEMFDAMMYAPVVNIDIARFMIGVGFDNRNPIHAANFMQVSLLFQCIFTIAGVYLICRSAGCRRSLALVGVGLALTSDGISKVGRFFFYRIFDERSVHLDFD